MINNNWYQRQLDSIADVHGSISANSPKSIKKLIKNCTGISVSDDDAEKIASAAKRANDQSEIRAVLKEASKLPEAAARSLAQTIMLAR